MRTPFARPALARWLGLSLLVLVVSPAWALVSIEPDLAQTLRERGAYEAVMARLIDAEARGFFATEGVARPDSLGKLASWHALFLLVDFADEPATGQYGIPEWESLLTSDGTHPTGSLRDFYRENSYGTFEVTGDVVGWYRMPQPRSYYSNFDGIADTADDHGFGSYPHNVKRLVEDAIAAADPDVNFADYLNGFANVRGVFVIHSGRGAETTADPDDIWSHFAGHVVPTSDGVDVASYTTEPELQSFSQATVGVFVHEFGHVLTLPDLYDVDGSSSGVGRWSVMGSGSWNGGGTKPAHFDAWCKRSLGYVSTTLLSQDVQGLVLEPTTTVPLVHRIQDQAHASGEYLLLEYRKRTGFDANLPSSGLLVWHVDANMSSNADESCGPGVQHPKVRLIQADGQCDLEAGTSGGDAGDPFPGSTGNDRLGSVTVPDTRSYGGDKTGILLDNIVLAGYDVILDVVLDESVQLGLPSPSFPDLQDALDLLGDGDEVRLQAGFTVLGNYTIGRGIAVTGGWDASFQSQLPQATSTVEGVGVLLPLLTVTSQDQPARLERLVLRGGGGRRVFQPFEAWRGGGVHVASGNLTVVGCRFESNAAGPNDTLPSSGGALYAAGGDVVIESSSFAGNFAKEAGDIHVVGGTLTLRDSSFEGGMLYSPGGVQRGGSVLAEGATLWVEDCTATGYTTADEGGFLYGTGPVFATLQNLAVDACASDGHGGGLYLDVDGIAADGVSLQNNHADGLGGGAYLHAPSVQWTNGLAADNSSDATGGGLHLEGALAGSRLASTTFSRNTAPYVGGALVLSQCTMSAEHLVFYANVASVAGGAMQVNEGLVSLRNSIFVANDAGAVLWSGVVGQLDYNLFWNNLGGEPVFGAAAGPNTLSVDPLFLNALTGDFHLAPGSEAIDAGDPLGPVDFDGSFPDLGVHGGSDDDGVRPGLLTVSLEQAGSDTRLEWQFSTSGTPVAEVWIYGGEITGLPKRTPLELLAVVPAPATHWDLDDSFGLAYVLQAVDASGRAGAYSEAVTMPVAVDALPARFRVGLPTPNPFNPRTRVAFELTQSQLVQADVFDLAGRRVRRLMRGKLPAGLHELEWDGLDDRSRSVGSGVYVFRLRSDEGVATRRLLLIK